MKFQKLLPILFFLAFVVSSCSGVREFKSGDVNLGKYKTFAYLPNSNSQLKNTAYSDKTINSTIIDAIKMNMEKGKFKLDRENPDLLVLISTKTNFGTVSSNEPEYASYPYSFSTAAVSPLYRDYLYQGYADFTDVRGYDTDDYFYKEGTVVIDIVDRKSHKIVWKGRSLKSIYSESRKSRVLELIDEIFDEYPLEKN